jgi:hypothetical protein
MAQSSDGLHELRTLSFVLPALCPATWRAAAENECVLTTPPSIVRLLCLGSIRFGNARTQAVKWIESAITLRFSIPTVLSADRKSGASIWADLPPSLTPQLNGLDALPPSRRHVRLNAHCGKWKHCAALVEARRRHRGMDGTSRARDTHFRRGYLRAIYAS